MMTDNDKAILEGIILKVKGGQFIQVKNYCNAEGEVSDYYVHGNSNYERVHEESLKALKDMRNDPGFSLEVVRNAYFDDAGVEYNRKAAGRTIRELRETIKQGNPALVEAFDKVEKSITAPKEVESNFEGRDSAYELDGEIYLRNVLVETKVKIKDGVYPVTCSGLVPTLVKMIKAKLPIGKYRSFKLDGTNCESLSASGDVFIFPK